MKTLRYWNGRSPYHFGRDHAYIAAYSKAEAVRLAVEAFGGFSISELNNYWSEAWGNPAMSAVGLPEEPGVYLSIGKSFFKFVGKAE